MIVSIGEVVWDIIGEKEILGGAPVNVAYHLASLGLDVGVVTRVGDDSLGRRTIAKLQDLGVPVNGVQVDPYLDTGVVLVTFGKDHEPSFEIKQPAAWDSIDAQEAFSLLGSEPFSLVYGTLAQRHQRSRTTIRSLLEKASFCFYDVNLRPPFTTRDLVCPSLEAADLVKLNLDELYTVAGWLDLGQGDKHEIAALITETFKLTAIVVTEGGDGAWLLAEGKLYEDRGEPVEVADTVGSGDAFFAALIEGYTAKRPWAECLARANRRGGFVAACQGATPSMPNKI